MEAIPGLIEGAIAAAPNVTFDRAHFLSFGDFSLNYGVVYFVETSDYAVYMDAQQRINLAIKAAFEERHIDFAYPTQLLYLANNGADGADNNGNGRQAVQTATVN
jgi:small-conductance mechanosensitive channel